MNFVILCADSGDDPGHRYQYAYVHLNQRHVWAELRLTVTCWKLCNRAWPREKEHISHHNHKKSRRHKCPNGSVLQWQPAAEINRGYTVQQERKWKQDTVLAEKWESLYLMIISWSNFSKIFSQCLTILCIYNQDLIHKTWSHITHQYPSPAKTVLHGCSPLLYSCGAD